MRPRPGYDFCEFIPTFLVPVAKERKHTDVYNFGIGDIYGIPGYVEILEEVLREVLPQAADYLMRLPGQQGFGPLCEELARIHGEISGRKFERDNVLLTEGGCSGISVALSAVQEPGAKVAYAVPSFPYWCTLESAGFQSIPLPFHDPEEYAVTYGNRLREAIESDGQIRAIILNEPQNPMGFPLDDTQLRVIGELADEHDLQVIVDDVAVAFAFCTREWSARYINEARCFVVGSFTKQFAVTGLRLGWLITPRSKLPAARSIVSNLRGGVSNLAAVFGFQLLRHLTSQGSSNVVDDEIRRRIEETRLLAQQTSKDVRFWAPDQGLYILGRIYGKHFTSATEFVTALRKQGVCLMDHRFLFPPYLQSGDAASLFRFSIGGEPRTHEGIEHMLLSIENCFSRGLTK